MSKYLIKLMNSDGRRGFVCPSDLFFSLVAAGSGTEVASHPDKTETA